MGPAASNDFRVLTSSFAAVRLNGDRRNSRATGVVIQIPEGSSISVMGDSRRLSGLVEIEWKNSVYAAFPIDLSEKSQAIRLD